MKIPCTACGAFILLTTAHATGGVCMACKQGIRARLKVKKSPGPKPSESRRYYYSTDGTDVNGPISDLAFWEMLQAGILPRSLQVCREGTEEWQAISLPATEAASPVATDPSENAAARLEDVKTPATLTDAQKGERVVEIIGRYSWGALGAMVAIPVPGADMAATVAVWGKMIYEIAGVYGYAVSFEDARDLGSDLFKSVVLTTAAWFASAKTASFIFKFIPVAGTVAGYAIDAAVAGFGAKKITARLGTAAALYYRSGKTMAPQTMAAHVMNVADLNTVRQALGLFSFGIGLDEIDGAGSGHGHHDRLS